MEGFLGMWGCYAKTQKVPGQPGQVSLILFLIEKEKNAHTQNTSKQKKETIHSKGENVQVLLTLS